MTLVNTSARAYSYVTRPISVRTCVFASITTPDPTASQVRSSPRRVCKNTNRQLSLQRECNVKLVLKANAKNRQKEMLESLELILRGYLGDRALSSDSVESLDDNRKALSPSHGGRLTFAIIV